MISYQDLQAIEDSDKARMEFVRQVISDHKNSENYKTAEIADEYARHQNRTIMNFQKMLYTLTGEATPDPYSANYKMPSNFFERFVTQENQTLLGNGATWQKKDTADKLGNKRYPFDTQLQIIGKNALIHGVSFGFFNLDHVEAFNYLQFAPLFDEVNGSLSAGVRFWQIDENKPLRATLYELDGYTEYIWEDGKDGRILQPKRTYKVNVRSSVVDGEEIYPASNYEGFPIVPLWGNTYHQSGIVGLREQIDCYDLIKSGFANSVDEASIVYWTITNAGGMDDIDLTQFLQRLKRVHAATLDDQEQVQQHSVNVPIAERSALLALLENDLYKDAMALNTDTIASGAVTATQIKAAYEPLNSKIDDYEYCVRQFVSNILDLAGIDDIPNFQRSMNINQTEELNNILQAAQYLPTEYVTRRILALFGDADKADEIIAQINSDNMSRMGLMVGGEDEETVEADQGEETAD